MTMPPVPEADMLTGMVGATAAPAAATPSTTPEDDAEAAQPHAEAKTTSNTADATLTGCRVGVNAHPSFPSCAPPPAPHADALEAFPVGARAPWRSTEWGSGSVPWTETLAEAILLTCNKLGLELRTLWVARAALLYLVSGEGEECADALQQRPATLSAIPSSLTRMPASALQDKAQLALALMQTLDRNRRQSRLTRELLQPAAMRLALRLHAKLSGAATAGRIGGRWGTNAAAPHFEARRSAASAAGVTSEGKAPTGALFASNVAAAPRPQTGRTFVNLERYLAERLLPALYAELVHYCRAVEQWHDKSFQAVPPTHVEGVVAAAAPAAATVAATQLHRRKPHSSASDGRACLPNISRSGVETFSLLAAVLHRALGLHSVVRRGDAIRFDLNEGGIDAYAAGVPWNREMTSDPGADSGPSVGTRPQRERPLGHPAVPLRAFRITMEAVTAWLEAAGGPQTGALESGLSRSVSRPLPTGHTVRVASPPPFVPPHTLADAGAPCLRTGGNSPLPPSSSVSVSRFGDAAASSRGQPPRASSTTASSPTTAGEGLGGAAADSGRPHATRTAPAPTVPFGSFNVDALLPILSLCGHDRSFRLFLTTAAGETSAATSPTGSVIPTSATTAATSKARVEEDLSALAAAISRLLLLGIYWAPLCRTYQLPAVLGMLARVATTELTHAATATSALTASAEVTANPYIAASTPTATSPSTEEASEATLTGLDAEVLQRARHTLLPPCDHLATPSSPFVQQLRRLVYSSGRYMERAVFATFVPITTMLDRVLSKWPMPYPAATALASACSVSGHTNVGRSSVRDDGGEGGTVSDVHGPPSAPTASPLQGHDATARTGGSASATDAAGASVSHATGPSAIFRAPVAAAMGTVTLFAAITDEFWSRERGRALWKSVSRRAKRNPSDASSAARTRAPHSNFLWLYSSCPTHTVIRVTVPNRYGDGAASSHLQEGLPAPFYVLRQLGLSSASAEHASTPEELLRAYHASERMTSYMAVRNGVGCATAMRPYLCEYLRSDYMWRSISSDALAPLVTALMELELASVSLPELLWLSGSLMGSSGAKRGRTSNSSLQRRASGCLSLHTMLSLMARIEPHELRLLTADGEDAHWLCAATSPCGLQELPEAGSSGSDDKSLLLRFTLRRIGADGCVLDPPLALATTPRTPHPPVGGRSSDSSSLTFHSAPVQDAGRARTKKCFAGEPTCYACRSVADVVWDSACSQSSDEGARLPLAAFAPLLRSMMLLAEAERPIDDAALHAAADCHGDDSSRGSSMCYYTGAGPLDARHVDSILRMAYRLLFGSGAEVSAAAAPAAAVPLEALVTLYLSLQRAAKEQTASLHKSVHGAQVAPWKPTETVPVADDGACERGSEMRSSAPQTLLLSLNCCLAHCEVALRQRLMAIAPGTASSSTGEALSTAPESIATDLRVLLPLAVLAEGLLPCPANVDAPATGAAGLSVDELIHRELFCELRAALREASLHRIAGEVSRLLWWVTRRAHAEVKEAGTAALPPLTSWVETLLLRAIGEKRRSDTGWRTFELFEWALLPLYTKLEARQAGADTTAETAERAAATPLRHDSALERLFDDFTLLEDTYMRHSAMAPAGALPQQTSSMQGLATKSPSGAETGSAGVNSDARAAAPAASDLSAVPHTAMLEAALHALPTQCDSFHTFLHVIRQLFLSHPALLSTAPDAALYYELRTARIAATGEKRTAPTDAGDPVVWGVDGTLAGRQAWATLPVQRAELPQDLRQRYVDTLFRLFKRLVHDYSCTAEELVELLHLLWLADPHASRVAFSEASSPMTLRSQWPSLFSCCRGFVKNSLNELDTADAVDSGDGNGAAASWSRHRSMPDVLQILYRTARYGIGKSFLLKPLDMQWASVNAAVLHPRSVVLFLHCLGIVRELEGQRRPHASAPHPLSVPRLARRQQGQPQGLRSRSPSHKEALELFQPFLIYASITGEVIADVPRMHYIPWMLEALGETDPPLVLALIHAAFSGALWHGVAGEGGGGGEGRSRSRHRLLSGNALLYAKMMTGGPAASAATGLGDGGRFQWSGALAVGGRLPSHQLSESISATMAALLMVASSDQASSKAWGWGGKAGGPEATDSAMIAQAATQKRPSASIGKAHLRTLVFLRNALFQQLWTARARQPLQWVPAHTIAQVMQLAVVQSSPRLLKLLEWLVLSLLLPPVMPTSRPAAANRPPRRPSGVCAASLVPFSASSALPSSANRGGGSAGEKESDVDMTAGDAAANTRLEVTRDGALLLRLLPMSLWRSLLQRGVSWPRYRGYSLQLLFRGQRSLAVTGAESDTAGASRAASIQRANRRRESLASVLLSLNSESVTYLIAEAMGPMVLLAVTTELLRALARQRACSGDGPRTARRNAEDVAQTEAATTGAAARADDRQPATAEQTPAGTAVPNGARNDTPPPESLTSFGVVRSHASAGSVLTEEALQPLLKAACDVIDQLASTRHTDFVAVLEREAAWQRRVAEASTYRGPAAGEMPFGVDAEAAVDAAAAAKAAPGATRSGAPEAIVPVLDLGEDGVAEMSSIGNDDEEQDVPSLGATAATAAPGGATVSGGGGRSAAEGSAMTTGLSMPATAADAAAGERVDNSDTVSEGPLVLDWRPISEFVQVVRQVDPGISQRQVRLESWVPLAEAAEANERDNARDVLHNALGAIMQHVRRYWQTSEQAHRMRPLMVMNLRDALHLYAFDAQHVCDAADGADSGQVRISPYEDDAAGLASGATLSPASDSTPGPALGVEQARWLESGAGNRVFVDGGGHAAAPLSSSATTVVLGLARPSPSLSISSIRAATAAVGATKAGVHLRRRIALLRRAGVLASAQEMAQRCRAYGLSAATRCADAPAWQRTRAADFWRRKSQRLQLEVLECVFGGADPTGAALACSHVAEKEGAKNEDAAAVAAEQPVRGACMPSLERRVRRRLQLLRCHDLAQLLLLLLAASATPASPRAKEEADDTMGTLHSLRQLQMRVVMETMAELLPSASTGELMQVVLALLKLSIPAASPSASSTDPTASQALHYARHEARRLLANVAVLVANDAERFSFRELLWLITRLHTPCIRSAPAATVAPDPSSAQQVRGETIVRPAQSTPLGDQPLDVSMSHVSAAAARAIRISIEGTNSLEDDEKGKDADAEDDDGDGTGGRCDGAAPLDADVPVGLQPASPVTVAQWRSAVAAAELLQGMQQMRSLLRLVELSAV
ncbi:hypothetical protein LSCM1_07989 [Leishmania martiniquensis]|uniref:Uncharacterized protein n=1 Tax=Leishmania martiniquensis TaxID=1580590 RepID=A0A836HMA9_9TRYP|nr:hypothetical protein LSCM1_07989 [Leishmania martiniquensis]